MQQGSFNLFIYGSLRDPAIFKSVCGLSFSLNPSETSNDTLLAERAILPNYRRISPDNVYFYAVPDLFSRIEGFIVCDVPQKALKEINRFEGRRYDRDTVRVNTANGLVEAQAYLVSHEKMKKRFGDRFHVNLIHELWLRKRIEEFIKKRTRPGDTTADAELERRADRELLATTERDLVISHYRADSISDYYLEHELTRPRPSIKPLYSEPEAKPYIKNYLELVLKQVLLNQLDEKIQSQFRFDLEHMRTSERYFKRSVSLLIGLQTINSNAPSVNLAIERFLKKTSYEKCDLIDYVKYAIQLADNIFDARIIKAHLDRLRVNFDPGLMPLGAELELSNLGSRTIPASKNEPVPAEQAYNAFKYFSDFRLDVLGWKLGSYIDDNSDDIEPRRRQGFLELAPGRLNVTAELSRPATADPWLLNQLIHEITAFFDVAPHSLHLSFQLRKNQAGKQKLLSLDFVKCLLVLGGGLEQKEDGKLLISRVANGEIIQRQPAEEFVFARTSKRRWYMGGAEIADKVPTQAAAYVQQYKFIRLEKTADYEPLIMCLKGLQLAFNPADYLTAEQLKASKQLRDDYENLKKWSLNPEAINDKAIGEFLGVVRSGLLIERRYKSVHKPHHIDWALSEIEIKLRMFNKMLASS